MFMSIIWGIFFFGFGYSSSISKPIFFKPFNTIIYEYLGLESGTERDLLTAAVKNLLNEEILLHSPIKMISLLISTGSTKILEKIIKNTKINGVFNIEIALNEAINNNHLDMLRLLANLQLFDLNEAKIIFKIIKNGNFDVFKLFLSDRYFYDGLNPGTFLYEFMIKSKKRKDFQIYIQNRNSKVQKMKKIYFSFYILLGSFYPRVFQFTFLLILFSALFKQ